MVAEMGATMPTGGITVGATPPAQHVPQEAGQPPAQTPTTTTTTRRSGENRRVSVISWISKNFFTLIFRYNIA